MCSGAELTITNSELAREKMWARIHLIPALQAEEDRDQVRRYLADKAREKELLGTETRVYHSDRSVYRAVFLRTWANELQVRPTHIRHHTRERDKVRKWMICRIGGEVWGTIVHIKMSEVGMPRERVPLRLHRMENARQSNLCFSLVSMLYSICETYLLGHAS
jgi:hypothetical protein